VTRKLVLALLLLLAATPAAADPGPGQVGAVAADWTLDALGGGTYQLNDYRNEKVVFFFVVGWG
jgi:hypothetical protein